MKLENIFNDYLEFCNLYRRKGTYDHYKQDFKLLSTVLNDLKIEHTRQLNQKTYNSIVSWLKTNTNKKNSKINDVLNSLKAALNYSKIECNFVQHRLVDDTTHYRTLNDVELKKFLKYLKSLDLNKSNNRVWVTTAYVMLDTGARKNEALNIMTKDIDTDSKIIHLETTKNKKRAVRYGRLSATLIEQLKKDNNLYLLHNKLRNTRLTAKSIEVFFKKASQELNLSSGNIHPHRLRKTFATQLLKNGCPLPTIQRFLGHSDIKMTMVYLDIDIFMLNSDYSKYYPYKK